MKNENQTSNLNFKVQLFWKSKNRLFWCFLSQFSIETKIKTLFLISYFNLSKKRNGNLGTRILFWNTKNKPLSIAKYVLLSNRENVLLTNKSCSYHTKIDLCSKIETSLISNTKNMLISNTNVTYFYKKSTHHK